MITWGLEFECLLHKYYNLYRDNVKFYTDLLPEDWKLTYDDSINVGRIKTKNGYKHTHELRLFSAEIITPIFHNNIPKELFDFIDITSPWVTDTCGLHFHFSFPHNYKLDKEKLEYCLDKIFSRTTKHSRYRWVSKNNNNKKYLNKYYNILGEHRFHGKYRALRDVSVIDNHYEIRIFNGTTNKRGIQQQFKQAKKLVENNLSGVLGTIS